MHPSLDGKRTDLEEVILCFEDAEARQVELVGVRATPRNGER